MITSGSQNVLFSEAWQHELTWARSVLWLVQVPWNPEVDLCWHSLIGGASEECEPVWCDSEDPLFILYTSGSTGKPKVDPLNNPIYLWCVICCSYIYLLFVPLFLPLYHSARVCCIQWVDTCSTLRPPLRWCSIITLMMCTGALRTLVGSPVTRTSHTGPWPMVRPVCWWGEHPEKHFLCLILLFIVTF